MEQWYWKWKFFLFNIFLRISTIDTIFCPLSVILKIIVSYNFFSLANLMHVNSKYFFEKSESVSLSLLPHGLKHARLFCPWNSPGKNTGMGSHSLLQGIFLTQGSNPGLLHCRWFYYYWATMLGTYILMNVVSSSCVDAFIII